MPEPSPPDLQRADGAAGQADTPRTHAGSERARRPEGAEADPADWGPAPPRTKDTLLGQLNRRGFRMTMALDGMGLVAVLITSMVARHGWAWPSYPMWLYLLSFTIIFAVFLVTFYFGGLYEREPRLGRPPVLPWATRQSLVAAGIVALGNLVVTGIAQRYGVQAGRALPIPTVNLIMLMIASPLVVAGVRWLSSQVRTRREGPPRVVLVGSADQLEVARSHLDLDRAHVTVVGATTDPDDIFRVVDEADATDLLLLSGELSASLYPDLVDRLDRRRISVLQRVTAAETLYGLARVRQVGGMPLVLLRPHVIPRSRANLKRATDLFLLLLGLPLWLPLLVMLAVYVRVAIGSPVLYWQERVGARGRIFPLVKFRTMKPAAEEDGNPRLASQDDPRIVPAARWLRATRMDELPQVYNVLRGEMSLVGPRPERPELTSHFEEEIRGYARRHEVPPGLTGLAQIHGHYHTDPEYKLGYDLQYVANWSPLLDFEILLRTVWVVLSQRI